MNQTLEVWTKTDGGKEVRRETFKGYVVGHFLCGPFSRVCLVLLIWGSQVRILPGAPYNSICYIISTRVHPSPRHTDGTIQHNKPRSLLYGTNAIVDLSGDSLSLSNEGVNIEIHSARILMKYSLYH